MDFGLGVLLNAKDLFSGTFQRAGMAFQQFEGTSSASSAKIGDNLKSLAIGMGLFSAGIAGMALLGSTVQKFSEFGQKIAEITTLTDEASLNNRALSDTVLAMNASYGGGTAKQAKALYDGISAGASNAAEATAIMSVSNRLAVAGVTDVGVALDGLTSSVNAYGDNFKNAGKYADTFMVAVQQGKTTIPEMSHVIGSVAPTASALKISFDELGGAIAAVTAKGIKTNEAATGLKAVFANVLKPAGDAAAEASRLGIKFDQTTLRQKGLKGFLDSITSAKGYKDTTMSKLFASVEGLNTVLALTANGGKKFTETMDAMKDKGGAAEKAFKKMEATLAFQEKRFSALKENAQILIGEALEPAAAAAVKFGNNMLLAFTEMNPAIRGMLVRGAMFLATLLTVVGGALAAKAAIGMLITGIGAAGMTFGGFLAAIIPVIVALGVVSLMFITFREAYDKNLGGIGKAVDRAVDSIKLIGAALSSLFETGGISGPLLDELNQAENGGIKNFVVRLYITGARVVEFFKNLSSAFFGAINAAGPSFDAFMAALSSLGELFGELFGIIDPTKAGESFDAFGSAGTSAGQKIAAVAIAIVDGLTAAMQFVRGFADNWVAVSSAAAKVRTEFDPILSQINQISAALGIQNEATASSTMTWGMWGARAAGAVGAVIGIVGAVVGAIAGQVDAVASTFSGVVDVIQGISNGSWRQVWHGMASIVYGIIRGITSMVNGMTVAIASAIDAAGKLAGKDFGLADKLRAEHTKQDAERRSFFGVDDKYDAKGVRVAPDSSVVGPPAGVRPENLYGSIAATVPTQDASGGGALQFAAIAEKLAASKAAAPPPINLSLALSMDGEQIVSKIESVSRDSANRSFSSGIPISG